MPRRKNRSASAPSMEVIRSAAIHATTDQNLRELVVMFVDIMGASEVSNHKSPQEYAKFVKEFQEIFREVCDLYVKTFYNNEQQRHIKYDTRGDEGLLLVYPLRTRSADVAMDIDITIQIALELKRRWLYSQENTARINEYDLLPIDLGIGIHAGVTYLVENKPEGYTINLAKRVEGHSRQGRFTHILLSESAHGYLNDLADEITYLFDEPQMINPKGISRDIRVYEVKHHFLPSDWQEESAPSRRSKTLLNPPNESAVKTLERALKINPTNLWLAEEFIRASILYQYDRLSSEDRNKEDSLSNAFRPALQRADILRQGNQRDAGIMFIHGLIDGECCNYKDERHNYDDAILYSDQLAQAYYYRGLSYSYDLADQINADTSVEYSGITAEQQEFADKSISDLKQAKRMRPQCAWMHYDYACELIRWRKAEHELNEAFDNIDHAVSLLEVVRERICTQDYLQSVLDHPRIKRLLKKVP